MKTTTKRLFGLAGLATVFALSTASWRSGGGLSSSSNTAVEDGSIPNAPFHEFTAAEFKAKESYAPQGGITIVFRSCDSTLFTNALEELNDLYNGVDFWADSTQYDGVRIRAAFSVFADSLTNPRTSRFLSLSETQQIAGYGKETYEILIGIPSVKRFGARGLTAGVKPTYGSETGMSRDYIAAALNGWQTALQTKQLPTATGLCWGDERYQLGILPHLEAKGIYYAAQPALHIQTTQSGYAAREGFALDDPSYDQFVCARMQNNGFQAWIGHHEIGSKTPVWNLGGRKWDSTNDPGGTVDSVGAWVDQGIHGNCTGLLFFDGEVGSAGGANDITVSSFRTFLAHVARRTIEIRKDGTPRLVSLTLKQLYKRKTGRRIGNILNHDGFAVLGSDGTDADGNQFDYGRKASKLRRAFISASSPSIANRAPICWSMANEHFGGGSGDTFRTVGAGADTGTSGNCRPVVRRLSVGGDSVALAYPLADSISYGLSADDANVIMEGFTDLTRGRPLYMQLPTMGCDPGVVYISGEFMVHSNVTFAADTLIVSYFFGQHTERWGDRMNEGPSSYQLACTIARLRAGPDSAGALAPDSLIHKARAWPQFAFGWVPNDTTSTGYMLGMFDANSGDWPWAKQLLAKMTGELLPEYLNQTASVGAGSWDYKNMLGNPKSLTTPAVGGHERFLDDITIVTERGRIYSFRITVDINERTDYVMGYLALEAHAGAVSQVPVMTWLDITASQ